MIQLPKQITRLPLKSEIDETIEFIGYSGYVPYSIISDIYCLLIHQFYGTDPYITPCDYTELLEEVVSHIDNNDDYDFLLTAVIVFKNLQSKINFRNVESNKNTIMIDPDGNQKNYKVNLTDYSRQVLDILDIDLDEDLNVIELSEEIQEILEFQNGVRIMTGKSLVNEVTVKEKMNNYASIGKIRKYKYGLPWFTTDLALKKPYIKKLKEEKCQHDKAIIMIDRSMSTARKSIYQHLVKAVLLNFVDTFEDSINELTVIEFTNTIINEVVITSKKELLNYINSDLKALMSTTTYKGGFIKLNKYFGKSITLITDGNADFVEELPNKIIWNVVSLEFDSKLSAKANNTRGKFIKM